MATTSEARGRGSAPSGPGRATARGLARWLASSLASSLALCACLPARASSEADQRGFVSEGLAGAWLFQPCRAGRPSAPALVLRDDTPGRSLSAGFNAVQQVRREPERPLYVEFRGSVSGDRMTARRFQRAIGHVEDCALASGHPTADVRLLAQGVDPAWRLVAGPADTRIERPGATPLRFAIALPKPSGRGDKVRSLSAAALRQGEPMRIEITEEACHDAAAEAAYGAVVVVTVDRQRLEGCAARF